MLFDAVKWVFGCPAKDRKHGVILEARDNLIAPFACRHHAAIEAEDKRELGTVKGDLRADWKGRVGCHIHATSVAAFFA